MSYNLLSSLSTLALLPAALALSGGIVAPPAPRLLVLSIDLNNLTNQPDDPAEQPRLAALAATLRRRLGGACGYQVVQLDSAVEARAHRGTGYFYAHPDVAAQLAETVGADWVLVPRLNRASPWVADFQLHVVRVGDGALVSNRVVELKGFGMSPDLTARLTERGAAWMADQVAQAIDWSTTGDHAKARRCPA